MTFEQFMASLQDTSAPAEASKPLQALWEAKQGAWEKAHGIVQDLSSSEAAWVHAFLHRQEGDEANAGYWYSRAGRKAFQGSLEDEWASISRQLLSA